MYHRLQIFYAVIALLSAVALGGVFVVNFSNNWVTFPEENGTPSYGVWKACAHFPDEMGSGCRRWCKFLSKIHFVSFSSCTMTTFRGYSMERRSSSCATRYQGSSFFLHYGDGVQPGSCLLRLLCHCMCI